VLELEAQRDGTLPSLSARSEEAWTVRETGARERARRMASRCEGVWHAAGSTVTMRAGTRCETHLGLHDATGLLRVGPGLLPQAVLLRLDPPSTPTHLPPPEPAAEESPPTP